MRLTPVPVKSGVLRVASVAFRTRQIAAICASEMLIGWPACSRAVTTISARWSTLRIWTVRFSSIR
jgi:hypothetical protein